MLSHSKILRGDICGDLQKLTLESGHHFVGNLMSYQELACGVLENIFAVQCGDV